MGGDSLLHVAAAFGKYDRCSHCNLLISLQKVVCRILIPLELSSISVITVLSLSGFSTTIDYPETRSANRLVGSYNATSDMS